MNRDRVDIKLGDFSNVAKFYAENRPDYSKEVLDQLSNNLPRNIKESDVVDVGAGTGIWTRMIENLNPKSIRAIEPNNEMRSQGQKFYNTSRIEWLNGSAEKIPLPDNCCDWVTMASSFHWANFEKATKEFSRILKPNGMFTALWNPRKITASSLLLEIEEYAKSLKPGLKRVSSGLKKNNETLATNLKNLPFFGDLTYIEGTHTLNLSRDRYLGIWKSVNDLQAQLGPEKFSAFIEFIEDKTASLETIEASYITRAWTVKNFA